MSDTTTTVTTPTTTTKSRVAKKPCSEKQLKANRLNSLKSRGAVTERGRQRSSMNNLRHGMRSRKEILPGESGAAYAKLRADLHASLGPQDATEEALVDRMARLEWRGRRGEAAEDARASKRIHEVVEGATRRDAVRVAALGADLDNCPQNVEQLLRFPAGVRYMIQEWSILRDRLAKAPSLLASQRIHALALVGKQRQDALRDDPAALRWVRALIGTMGGAGATTEKVGGMLGTAARPEQMSLEEYNIRLEDLARSLKGRAEAKAQLVAYVAEEIGRLEQHLKVIEPLAARNLALDQEEARVKVTVEGARLSGYIMSSYRGADASLRRLEARQNPKRPRPARGPKKAEAPAPAPQQRPAPAPAPCTQPTPSREPPTPPAATAAPPAPAATLEIAVETPQPPVDEAVPQRIPDASVVQKRAYEAILEVPVEDPPAAPAPPPAPAPKPDPEAGPETSVAADLPFDLVSWEKARRQREEEQAQQERREREELARKLDAYIRSQGPGNRAAPGGHVPIPGDHAGRPPPAPS
jgi:hypothetical protein